MRALQIVRIIAADTAASTPARSQIASQTWYRMDNAQHRSSLLNQSDIYRKLVGPREELLRAIQGIHQPEGSRASGKAVGCFFHLLQITRTSGVRDRRDSIRKLCEAPSAEVSGDASFFHLTSAPPS